MTKEEFFRKVREEYSVRIVVGIVSTITVGIAALLWQYTSKVILPTWNFLMIDLHMPLLVYILFIIIIAGTLWACRIYSKKYQALLIEHETQDEDQLSPEMQGEVCVVEYPDDETQKKIDTLQENYTQFGIKWTWETTVHTMTGKYFISNLKMFCPECMLELDFERKAYVPRPNIGSLGRRYLSITCPDCDKEFYKCDDPNKSWGEVMELVKRYIERDLRKLVT